eukprot:SAG11_NODE_280_length_11266_cov_28.949499_4_plen_124_part_00
MTEDAPGAPQREKELTDGGAPDSEAPSVRDEHLNRAFKKLDMDESGTVSAEVMGVWLKFRHDKCVSDPSLPRTVRIVTFATNTSMCNNLRTNTLRCVSTSAVHANPSGWQTMRVLSRASSVHP